MNLTNSDKLWAEHMVDMSLQFNPEQMTEGYDTSIQIAVATFSFAANNLNTNTQDRVERVYEAMCYAQALWEHICEYIEKNGEGIICQKIGLISTLIILSKYQEGSNQWLYGAIQDSAAKIIKDRGSELLNDPVPVFPTMSQEEIDQYIDQSDPNLINEFFTLFQEIKTFHTDPAKYTDPEDVERHKKMMAIFSKITSARNESE